MMSYGGVLCGAVSIYFAAVALYALANFAEFGATAHHFIRYIFAPTLIAVGLLLAVIRSSPARSLAIGVNSWAVLIAAFAYEAIMEFHVWQSLTATVRAGVEEADSPAGTAPVAHSLPLGMTIRQLNNAMDVEKLSGAMLGGLPDRDVFLCIHEEKGRLYYRADRFGFNNPDDAYDSGPLDVLLLGDSFMEGICLEPGDDVAGQLRANGVRAVTLGMRGNGPLLEFATLGRYGKLLNPRHVVMVYYAGNDWSNLDYELQLGWQREALDPNVDFGAALVSARAIEHAEQVVNSAWAKRDEASVVNIQGRAVRNFFALVQVWSVLGLHYPSAPTPQPAFEEVLKQSKSLAQENGADFTLVFVPRKERYRGLLPNRFAFIQDQKVVLEAARQAQIDVIDLAEEFDGRGDPLKMYSAAGGHFSEEGARVVARLIRERLSLKPAADED
jgi:hypothetical protein